MTTLTAAVDKATSIAAKNPGAIPANALAAVQAEVGVNPAMALTRNALRTSGNGLKTVWAHEKEFQTGLMFLTFTKEAFVAIALPILSLVWLALKTGYITARKPETKAFFVGRYTALKAWAASKFSYSRDENA